MNAAETALWENISQFQFDDPGTSFKFSDRLARENGWSIQYANRVIAEYKKFIFLCCVSTAGITPSDPIDQAWHLHLTYTRSYWIDLCQNTLGRQIHHHPTKGGEKEANRFKGYYKSSNNLYLEYFGISPPTDIWHKSNQRFADINFQRANLRKYWLVRKPNFSKYHFVYISALLAFGLFIQAAELTIIPVLAVIVVVIVATVYTGNNSRKNQDKENGTGCTAGFGGDDGSEHSNHHESGSSHHSGDSGCSSGCSDSGCSGSSSD